MGRLLPFARSTFGSLVVGDDRSLPGMEHVEQELVRGRLDMATTSALGSIGK